MEGVRPEVLPASVSYSDWIYRSYFRMMKGFLDWTTAYNCRPLGLVVVTLSLELFPTISATARRFKYTQDPSVYNLNQFQEIHRGKRPVLVLHGRMGRWSDVADLAFQLQKRDFSVFVADVPENVPTEMGRKWMNENLLKIKEQYEKIFGEKAPPINLVGFSLGGELSLFTTFETECSTITSAYIQFTKHPKANPLIGKVITIGMPTTQQELEWITTAGKMNDFYNIIPEFDAIVDKRSALPAHRQFRVAQGHLGSLCLASYQKVESWLLDA